MITYDIDKKQPKKSKKTILEARLKLFLRVLIALILALAFYLTLKVKGI
ncbi:hypothetical protein JT202_07510 [Helicobacter pylori]|nr:hypothetical protein [Helicobacter pylori]WRA69952.1 hypothetical protein FE350_02825 [Helicobacter pylori]